MARAAGMHDRFPHVALRQTRHGREAYLPDTGLAVWEIAWVAGLYGRDIDATIGHLGQSRELIEEGLLYADEHAAEIELEINDHTADTPEELQAKIPGVALKVFDIMPSDQQHR